VKQRRRSEYPARRLADGIGHESQIEPSDPCSDELTTPTRRYILTSARDRPRRRGAWQNLAGHQTRSPPPDRQRRPEPKPRFHVKPLADPRLFARQRHRVAQGVSRAAPPDRRHRQLDPSSAEMTTAVTRLKTTGREAQRQLPPNHALDDRRSAPTRSRNAPSAPNAQGRQPHRDQRQRSNPTRRALGVTCSVGE